MVRQYLLSRIDSHFMNSRTNGNDPTERVEHRAGAEKGTAGEVIAIPRHEPEAALLSRDHVLVISLGLPCVFYGATVVGADLGAYF